MRELSYNDPLRTDAVNPGVDSSISVPADDECLNLSSWGLPAAILEVLF